MFTTRLQIRSASKRLDTAACLLCQWRSFTTTYRRLDENGQKPPPVTPSVLDEAPRASGKRVEEFVPKPLDRAIGFPNPPRAGQNDGIDTRSIKERRDDFVNWDKHLAKRKKMTAAMAKPYFREWGNMKFSKGKSFIAPPRLFKADRALYFPNLYGRTLVKKPHPFADTTPLFQDKISVVSVYSSQWAENQAATFASEKNNPELHKVVKEGRGLAQMVQINIEENYLKAMLIKLFVPSLRKRFEESDWDKYFMVQKGITDNMRETIGLLNSKVGYTYLLDEECRIRWAGSGPAEDYEKDSLVKGVSRLLEEARHAANTARLIESRKAEEKVLKKVAEASA